jgi:hypothetical protein
MVADPLTYELQSGRLRVRVALDEWRILPVRLRHHIQERDDLAGPRAGARRWKPAGPCCRA